MPFRNDDEAPLQLENISFRLGGRTILHNLDAKLPLRQGWAIIGPSGSGKTVLGRVLAGQYRASGHLRYPRANYRIRWVDQQHHFRNLSHTRDLYYQQRYQSADAADTLTVSEYLAGRHSSAPILSSKWIGRLQLTPLLDRPLIQLSNGENKRLQIADALADPPDLLVFDNAFTGLDAEGRQTLETALEGILREGIDILWIGNRRLLPAWVTRVLLLQEGRIRYAGPVEGCPVSGGTAKAWSPAPFEPHQAQTFERAIDMKKVNVQYGEKRVLQDVNWTVRRGECWQIGGSNGAGKSTLLSLVTADNPQAYANEIYLFDKRRGRGESIWDIKRRMGLLSPELHLHFDRSAPVHHVIASGFFDSIGLFRALSAAQELQVQTWLRLLDLTGQGNRSFGLLPPGWQRLVLLARAMVKQPDLLVLDEPAQGLDEEQSAGLQQLVNRYCRETGCTLLYVTHVNSELPECISHELRLDGGRVIKSGAK